MTEKPQLLFLIGLVAAISIWVALTTILTSVGFSEGAAFNMAYTGALSVFGAFLYKIYKTFREAPAVSKPEAQRCLILAAPTHGVLQDRANYWLRGGYGKVISSAMTSTDKGFFLTVFYEGRGQPELPAARAIEQ